MNQGFNWSTTSVRSSAMDERTRYIHDFDIQTFSIVFLTIHVKRKRVGVTWQGLEVTFEVFKARFRRQNVGFHVCDFPLGSLLLFLVISRIEAKKRRAFICVAIERKFKSKEKVLRVLFSLERAAIPIWRPEARIQILGNHGNKS